MNVGAVMSRTHFRSLFHSHSSFKNPIRDPPPSSSSSMHSCDRLGFNIAPDKSLHSCFSHVAFVSSSGADFSGEPLVDDRAEEMVMKKRVKKKKKNKSVAGIEEDQMVDDPALLADPDSCFCEFRGVKIHHKICEPEPEPKDGSSETRVGLPLILLHGFGASVFSWSRVMKGLANVAGSRVLAFDRPAFGLTSRLELGPGQKALNPYSTAFSALATLFFIDLLGAEKAILVGHSAGSLVAVNSYFEAPERIAALILVAPAILAPLNSQREVVKEEQSDGDKQIEEESSSKESLRIPFLQLCSVFLFKFAKLVSQAIAQVVKGIAGELNSVYKKLLAAFLRSAIGVALVRIIIDKFGVMAVKNSWYDPKLVTQHIVDGYTKPLRAKGWDKALIEFTAAMLTDAAPESKPPISTRLGQISCPVLIVTGDSDRLVPAWNAERLSRAIPGSCFEVIRQCGHLPHEEKVDEFMAIVQKFLQKAFGGSPEKPQFEASLP